MVDYDAGLDSLRGKSEEKDANPVLSQLKVVTDTAMYQCWEFAEHRGQGAFLLFDFDEQRLGILIQSEYGLHNIFDLHRLEGGYSFSDDPARLNKLEEEMAAWLERTKRIFKTNRVKTPRKIWVMRDFTRGENNSKRVIDYTPASTPLLDFENALGEWQDILAATGWQNFLI